MPTMTTGAFAHPATSLDFKTGSWRTARPLYHARPAPCHSGCPAGESPRDYLAHTAQGDLKTAWETLVAINPLPAIIGRVCGHPCEGACNRGHYDTPIAIHNVERLLGDEAIRAGWDYPLAPLAADAPKIAVVGAGPAGLSCAYHLRQLGLRATLIEQLPAAGGAMRTALPCYRLPRDVLDAEIERLMAIGITFLPNTALGRDLSLTELQEQYAAVFLGPGRNRSRPWSVDGRTPDDLHSALTLLREWIAFGSLPEIHSAAIVGGGSSAIDMSRVLARAGAQVHIVSLEALPGPGVPHAAAMKATARDIRQAQEEGVILHTEHSVHRLILRGEKVVGVELVRVKNVTQDNGRFEIVPFEGTETVLHVDQVIPAIGQEVEPAGMENLLDRHHFFAVDELGRHPERAGLFVGGDARRNAWGTTSGAIGDGRRAATAIYTYARGETGNQAAPQPEAIGFAGLNIHYFEPAARAEEPELLPQDRVGNAEIAGGLAAEQVITEAGRCFSCGSCMVCDNCWTLCPDQAVLKTRERPASGPPYIVDYDYCKGCGLCAHECPTGYIAMAPEPS
ncbi:MAG TPA: FAD-dependent oxidoreductase [Acidiferrobacter sp.]|nr:FAD-dependent oxidoreductase [Acidiferrobacter sp.]